MIKVKEYQGQRIRHQINLDMYQGKEAFALLDEKEAFARAEAEKWNTGKDFQLFVTRKPRDLIIRFMRRGFFNNGLGCFKRWESLKIDHYRIIE